MGSIKELLNLAASVGVCQRSGLDDIFPCPDCLTPLVVYEIGSQDDIWLYCRRCRQGQFLTSLLKFKYYCEIPLSSSASIYESIIKQIQKRLKSPPKSQLLLQSNPLSELSDYLKVLPKRYALGNVPFNTFLLPLYLLPGLVGGFLVVKSNKIITLLPKYDQFLYFPNSFLERSERFVFTIYDLINQKSWNSQISLLLPVLSPLNGTAFYLYKNLPLEAIQNSDLSILSPLIKGFLLLQSELNKEFINKFDNIYKSLSKSDKKKLQAYFGKELSLIYGTNEKGLVNLFGKTYCIAKDKTAIYEIKSENKKQISNFYNECDLVVQHNDSKLLLIRNYFNTNENRFYIDLLSNLENTKEFFSQYIKQTISNLPLLEEVPFVLNQDRQTLRLLFIDIPLKISKPSVIDITKIKYSVYSKIVNFLEYNLIIYNGNSYQPLGTSNKELISNLVRSTKTQFRSAVSLMYFLCKGLLIKQLLSKDDTAGIVVSKINKELIDQLLIKKFFNWETDFTDACKKSKSTNQAILIWEPEEVDVNVINSLSIKTLEALMIYKDINYSIFKQILIDAFKEYLPIKDYIEDLKLKDLTSTIQGSIYFFNLSGEKDANSFQSTSISEW